MSLCRDEANAKYFLEKYFVDENRTLGIFDFSNFYFYSLFPSGEQTDYHTETVRVPSREGRVPSRDGERDKSLCV